jgi:hypothetical protein
VYEFVRLVQYEFSIQYRLVQYYSIIKWKEFCFSLIGLNSIFSTLPQSEYALRAVSIPRVQWVHLAWGIFGLVSIFVYSVFQYCPTRDEISFPVGQSNCKKRSKFSKISKFQKFQNLKFLQNLKKNSKISYKISKLSKKIQNSKFSFFSFLMFKIFKKFQNFKNFIIFFIIFINLKIYKISKLSKIS